jgi:hypothetical protein
MTREIDTSEFYAKRFVTQCRRDARMFPRTHIEDVFCKREPSVLLKRRRAE